ncbi:hypothetical protein C2G38_2152325 [Gigaspora rosea]|uniref:Uncharacterized protein n=1 Tax=Gigaspora rosea TaxID=44941 RepID=A0A397W927_9GLOM|nr:hypothetical protein C2G38_2152325 [Gigaspora rosea]
MPSHTTLIVIIVTKENTNSLAHVEFSIGDIVMFASKFVIKNLEQHVTVSCANVIAVGDSNHEFEANEIPISVPHCMFHVIVSREPKECGESTYFEAYQTRISYDHAYFIMASASTAIIKIKIC